MIAPIHDRTCPKCHRPDCGLFLVSSLFWFHTVMARGIEHDIPIFKGSGKIAPPHIAGLDCPCQPEYAELTLDGIDTKTGKVIQEVRRLAFHCLIVPVFEPLGR